MILRAPTVATSSSTWGPTNLGGPFRHECQQQHARFAQSNPPVADPSDQRRPAAYLCQNSFKNDGSGVLADHMSVLNSSGTLLHTWVLSEPTDIIGSTVVATGTPASSITNSRDSHWTTSPGAAPLTPRALGSSPNRRDPVPGCCAAANQHCEHEQLVVEEQGWDPHHVQALLKDRACGVPVDRLE